MTMTVRFLHLSDLHLSTLSGIQRRRIRGKRVLGFLSWHRRRRHEHHPSVVQALLRTVRELDWDQTLITGDLTHLGFPEEFQETLDWLRQLGTPKSVAVVPGNHDAYAREPWEHTFSHWEPYISGDEPGAAFPSLRVRGPVAFLGLSTAKPTLPFMATGELGQQQRDALGRMLDITARQGLFRVVYLHHPPLPRGDKWRKRLVDDGALQRVLHEHGAELILHGHIHRARQHWFETLSGTFPVISLGSSSAIGRHDEAGSFAEFEVTCPTDTKGPKHWHLSHTQWRWQSARGIFQPGPRQNWTLKRDDITNPDQAGA